MEHTQEPAQNLVVRDSSGRDLQHAYPGYRWESTSSTEHRFRDDQGNIIIDILGHNENQEPVILYTLFNSDASLYDLLQWEDAYRAHPDICTVRTFKIVVLWAFAFLISLLMGIMYVPVKDVFHQTLVSVLGATVSSTVFVLFFLRIEKIWRIAKGFVRVWWYLRKHTAYLLIPFYYKDLFEELSLVGCPDKARSARIMTRWLA